MLIDDLSITIKQIVIILDKVENKTSLLLNIS